MMARPRYHIPQRQPNPAADPVRAVMLRATRLTPSELRAIVAPIEHCTARLREGLASELQFQILRTTMLIAQQIERTSHIRGLAGHIEAAMVALSTISDRAMAGGAWTPTAPNASELDAISTALELHQDQLRQLTAGELQAIVKRTIAQAQSQGGAKLVRVTPAQIVCAGVSA